MGRAQAAAFDSCQRDADASHEKEGVHDETERASP
jgi:hypothetical protein